MKSPAAPRIALCMIVRDEAERLGACLDAARPFVDRMIVGDTGSRDATRELARARGAEVLEVPWTDDFAAARNRVLEAADRDGADWILVLDADEVLAPETGAALRDAARRRDVFACYLPLVNVYDDRGATLSALLLRAWRRRPTIRFKNRIHEQVLHAVLPAAKAEGGRLVSLPGAVRHDGYRPEVVAERGKNERNLRLFERAVAEEPGDPYLRYKFAEFLRRFPEEAARRTALLDDGVAAMRRLGPAAAAELPFAAEFFALRADELREAGDAAAAAALCAEGAALTTPTPNLAYATGLAALAQGRAADAEAAFSRCLAFAGAPLVVPGRPGVVGARARRGRADALRLLGRHAEALGELAAALEESPSDAELVYEAWLDSATRAGDAKAALAWITGRLRRAPEDAGAWTTGGRLLEACGLLGEAAKFRRRAAELRDRGRDADAVRRARADRAAAAEAALRGGDWEGALATAAAARGDARAEAVLVAVCAAAGEPAPSFIDPAAPAVREAFQRLRTTLGACRARGPEILARLDDAARRPAAFDPTAAALLGEALL